jgi:hypothetical protein
LTHTIGPIFHLTSSDDLRKAGLRVAPMIQRVHTGWRWRPENKRDADLVDTKVIYRRILKQLEQGRGNVDRVGLIAKAILEQPLACAQLVVCKSLAYLDHLKTALEVGGYKGEILMLRGAERKQSVEIAAARDGGPLRPAVHGRRRGHRHPAPGSPAPRLAATQASHHHAASRAHPALAPRQARLGGLRLRRR